MTIVHIPPVLDGASSTLPATCTVRLVNAESVPVIGFVGETLATEYQTRSLTLTGLDLTLAAQSDIALPDGAETWYEVTISTQYRQEKYLVQVPDSPSPMQLHDLVGATEIPPGDITASVLAAAAQTAADRAAILRERRSAHDDPYDYMGVAPQGSAESADVWTITRLTIAADGTVSATVHASAVAWSDWASATYH